MSVMVEPFESCSRQNGIPYSARMHVAMTNKIASPVFSRVVNPRRCGRIARTEYRETEECASVLDWARIESVPRVSQCHGTVEPSG
jgi:hypothetical protein